jgi:ABC-type transport system involved in cytochrome bd biosynthesis fused ATPase/permease subunit
MLVITLNPSMSLFVIQGDAHQSLVLLQLMKRDEANLKYDAINPHQVYRLNICSHKQSLQHECNKVALTLLSLSPTMKIAMVISGPSGSGKSTLLNRLFAKYPSSFGFSVSRKT